VSQQKNSLLVAQRLRQSLPEGCRFNDPGPPVVELAGSEQEFDEVVISRRFGEDDEFGSCGSHLLSLQQQVTQVSVTAPASH
jgi:hypothetical protein